MVLEGPHDTLVPNRRCGALISACEASTTPRPVPATRGRKAWQGRQAARSPSRSSVLPLAILASAGIAGWPIGTAQAQAPKPVEIALIMPLSGPWARQGQLEKLGAEMAIDEINEKGGIKSMGGAKLRAHFHRCRRQRREGEERGAAPGRRASGRGRRPRCLAQHLHACDHRGDRARANSVADLVLRRLDHQPRL